MAAAAACALLGSSLGSLEVVRADAMPGGNTDAYEDTFNVHQPPTSPTSVTSSLFGGSTYAVGQRYGCTSYAPEGTAYGHHQCPASNPYWHHGIDISVPSSTQIYSTFSGTVHEICNATGARNGMSITTAAGFIVYLIHGTADLGISVGDSISIGERIYHSDTNVSCWGGNIAGAHLHLEVHQSLDFSHGGTWDDINPERWLAVSTPCTSVSVSSVAPPEPPTTYAGTPITITGAASGCPNPLYEFWAMWAGTSSYVLQTGYSTSATWTWNSAGAPTGTEHFAVWALDASSGGIGCQSSNCYDAYSTGVAYAVLVTPCTGETGNARPFSPQPSGTAIVVTGSASGCPNPRYEFWALWAGSSTWILQQAYSIYPTWTWDSTGAPPGTEHFGVWARDASSFPAAGYDVYISIPFTVT
jgi:hypothetical protein